MVGIGERREEGRGKGEERRRNGNRQEERGHVEG